MIKLDGRSVAKQVRTEVKGRVERCTQQGTVPTLAIVVATTDEGAWWYVKVLEKAAHSCGIATRIIELSPTATTDMIAQALQELAVDDTVHGLLLQTPLPPGVSADDLLELIPPAKDVDGANPVSAGRMLYGTPAFAPATAEAVLVILEQYNVALEGKRVTVVGRSRIVGKPVAHLLLARDATVTVCHSRSKDLRAHTLDAEVLVVAAGKPGLVTNDMVSPGVVIVDVGTNVVADELVGDVDSSVASVAGALTPVPGGVGPVTTTLILQHTVAATEQSLHI